MPSSATKIKKQNLVRKVHGSALDIVQLYFFHLVFNDLKHDL